MLELRGLMESDGGGSDGIRLSSRGFYNILRPKKS